MRARTPKRAVQEREYKEVCDEIDREALAAGEYKCFFCGKPIKGKADHHHLRGRSGALLTDKQWIVLAHHDHHLEFHDLPCRKQTWREIFMENLRVKDPQTYYKEREKENK